MTKYKEIFKLKKMLEDAHIPFSWVEHWGYEGEKLEEFRRTMPDLFEHYQICYPSSNETTRYMSIIEGFGTFGEAQDLLEVMGGYTEEETGGDTVMGSVTAEDVFNRIRKHYFRKGKFIMKKTMTVVNEDTLELREVVVEEDVTEEVAEDIVKEFQSALNCEPEEFYQKYREMKKAEADFNAVYEPFKENLIKLHEKDPSLPKSVVVGGTKLTYVSPSQRTTIDSKKLKEEEPEIAKKFTKTTNVSATIRLEEV